MTKDSKFLKNMRKEILCFFSLCTSDDINLFISEPKEKTIEDYGRFICLGLTFDFKSVFLNLIAQYEKVGDVEEIIDYLETITYELVNMWVEEFSDKISTPEMREWAQTVWKEKKKYFANNKFEIAKLLYS